ncbi:MAG: alpha/beta hydrolase-fold protein [Bryobacteraceae bacterium]|nr:alpha/beta hydrolase-fold protein [Bryobacteraceae bacterium]
MKLLVLVAVAAAAVAQPPPPAMSIGERVELRSELLNEVRHLVVVKPFGYDASRERYPVLYVLDGDQHYFHAAGILSFLAQNGRIPPMLLVAVPSLQRNRDMTPPTEDENEKRFFPIRGGADRFLEHLRDELVPFVDRSYRTRPYRILVGHSLGGLFVIHALTSEPRLFQGWIAISRASNGTGR